MADWGKVDRILERTRLTEKGELERIYRVEATTKGGIAFTLDLTEADADPKKAEVVLKAKATRLDTLKGL